MKVDALHSALTAPVANQLLLIERTDGHTSTADLDWWLRSNDATPPVDFDALNWITTGPVLDVGCCTGRHMERLAGRGIATHGIDICPGAVATAQDAGLDAETANVHDYRPAHPMRAVLALGGGIGIAGTRARVPEFLQRLASWLTADGTIVVSSLDWTATTDKHQAWVDAAHQAGRYPGEVRLRLRYGQLIGDWFDWVWVDPETLSAACHQVGLTITETRRWGAWYAALIQGQTP